jgi:Putative bacterial sensory transduction regulator
MKADQIERAIESLSRLLAEIGWSAEQIKPGMFNIDFGAPHLPVSTGLAAIVPESGQFIFYVNFGFLVPPTKREETLLLINRANWDLIIGSLELDLGDGHLRVKSAIDFDGADLTDTLIRNVVLGAMRVTEAYAPALMAIAVPRAGTDA